MEVKGHDVERWAGVVLPPAKVCTSSSLSNGLLINYSWSFGGNRLQIKAETRLMEDVDVALRAVSSTGLATTGTLRSLGNKQELLLALLDNERMRLEVWLYPLDHERRHVFPSLHLSKTHSEVSEQSQEMFEFKTYKLQGIHSSHLKNAWLVHPGLAIQLSARFQSARLRDEVRSLINSFPERALDEPDALQILLGSSLEIDTIHNLKVNRSLLVTNYNTNHADPASTCFTGLQQTP